MSSTLTVQCMTPFNPETAGILVEAWPATDFLHAPVSTDAYPPAASPAATGTTNSSGQVTLTGLSAVDYWVSIIDLSNKPNFRFVPAAYIGGSTFTARYTPDAVTAKPPALNFFAALLTSGIGADTGFGDLVPPTQVSIPTILPGEPWQYVASVVTPPLLCGAHSSLWTNSLGALQLPEFVGGGGSGWGVSWTLYLCDSTGANALVITETASVTLTSGGVLHPAFSTADPLNQVGADIVVPSSPASQITTTAGGYYRGYFGVLLNGTGPLS